MTYHLVLYVGFFCIAAYMVYSALTIRGDMIGDHIVRVMLFVVGTLMAVAVILAIIFLFKRPTSPESGPQRLIGQHYTGPQTEYCPVCHANIVNSNKCRNAGSRRNGNEYS